jgi:hypothetical protein
MHSITFETIVCKGMITVPAHYQKLFTDSVQVTVYITSLKKAAQSTDFRAVSLASQAFKFNREEANGR